MGNGSRLVLALRLLYAAWEWFRAARNDAVRADAGAAWLRRHGGADERVSPGSVDAGSDSDKH